MLSQRCTLHCFCATSDAAKLFTTSPARSATEHDRQRSLFCTTLDKAEGQGEDSFVFVFLASEKVKTHKCNRTGEEWNITAPITCVTKNVIYKLTCKRCPEWCYIGETARRFADRFTDHRGYVTRNESKQPAGQHFNLPGHKLEDLMGLAFERVLPAEDTMLRKVREKLWINRYEPVANVR